jgi:hypothetical protein
MQFDTTIATQVNGQSVLDTIKEESLIDLDI